MISGGNDRKVVTGFTRFSIARTIIVGVPRQQCGWDCDVIIHQVFGREYPLAFSRDVTKSCPQTQPPDTNLGIQGSVLI